MHNELHESAQVRAGLIAENASLLEKVSLFTKGNNQLGRTSLISLPCFDNNIWVTYPELETLIISRLKAAAPENEGSHKLRPSNKFLKRSIFGLVAELVVQITFFRFRIRERVEVPASQILGFSYSDFDKLDSTFFTRSKFWGELPGWLESTLPTSWFGLGTAGGDKSLKAQMTSLVRRAAAVREVIITLKARVQLWRFLNFECRDIEVFYHLRKEYRRAIFGAPAVEAEILLSEFRDTLDPNSAKLLLVPHENQLWERALCSVASEIGVPVLGFLHTTPRYWDLRFFDFGVFADMQPTFFISSGTAHHELLAASQIANEKILPGTALRFDHLATSKREPTEQTRASNELRTLVVTGTNRSAARRLIEWVTSVRGRSLLVVSLRPHPDNKNWIRSRFPKLPLDSSSFANLSKIYDLFITDSMSSMSLEFSAIGKRVAVFVPEETLNFSPLHLIDEFNGYFSDRGSLEAVIEGEASKVSIENVLALPNDKSKWLKLLREVVDGKRP